MQNRVCVTVVNRYLLLENIKGVLSQTAGVWSEDDPSMPGPRLSHARRYRAWGTVQSQFMGDFLLAFPDFSLYSFGLGFFIVYYHKMLMKR